MQLYNCKVRLDGSVANEVRKADATAAEIEILRAIHGDDAVVDIVETRMDRRAHAEERARLNAIYANPDTNNPEVFARKQALVRNLFGHDRMPLPLKLDGRYPPAPAPIERVDIEAELAEPESDAIPDVDPLE
jgi:hypothetical protein